MTEPKDPRATEGFPLPTGPSEYEELVNKLVAAFGISRTEVEARIANLKDKFGWTTVPANEVLKILLERADSDKIRNVITVTAQALAKLFNSGKSEIGESDPSALA